MCQNEHISLEYLTYIDIFLVLQTNGDKSFLFTFSLKFLRRTDFDLNAVFFLIIKVRFLTSFLGFWQKDGRFYVKDLRVYPGLSIKKQECGNQGQILTLVRMKVTNNTADNGRGEFSLNCTRRCFSP